MSQTAKPDIALCLAIKSLINISLKNEWVGLSWRSSGWDFIFWCRWCGLILGWGAKILHASWPKNLKTENRSNIVTNSIKTLKMVHIKKEKNEWGKWLKSPPLHKVFTIFPTTCNIFSFPQMPVINTANSTPQCTWSNYILLFLQGSTM